MNITFPDKDPLTSAAFGTMVLILASFRGLRSVHFVGDYNLAHWSDINVTLRVSATSGRPL